MPLPRPRPVTANRTWWDGEAAAYYVEHGEFLGDTDFVWGPERLREEDAGLLGDPRGQLVLEIGAGSGQCSRWLAARGATVVATDLSAGMVLEGLEVNSRVPAASRVPFVQCDGRTLPFPDAMPSTRSSRHTASCPSSATPTS